MSILSLKSHFSSAHLYHQPQWSEEKNREVFGRCFTKYGHGHNYTLEVGFVAGEISDAWIEEKKQVLHELTQVLDYEHLNFAIPEFKEKIPTTENIGLYFADKLKHEKISYLRVFETPDLWSEIRMD